MSNDYSSTAGNGLVDAGNLVAENSLDARLSLSADADHMATVYRQPKGCYSGIKLRRRRRSIGAWVAQAVRMKREGIPQEGSVEHPETREDFMHDRGAWLLTPVKADGGGRSERHTGLSGTLPSGRFAHKHEVAVFRRLQMLKQAIESLRRGRGEAAFQITAVEIEIGGCRSEWNCEQSIDKKR